MEGGFRYEIRPENGPGFVTQYWVIDHVVHGNDSFHLIRRDAERDIDLRLWRERTQAEQARVKLGGQS